MKQTAVEYMYNIMFEKKGRISKEEFEKAKAMEKGQITNAFNKGEIQGVKSTNNYYYSSLITAEQYYNETFKHD